MENNSDIISSKILKTKVSDFWFTVSTIIFCFATFYIAFQTVFEVGIWGTITLSAYIIIAKIFFDTKKIKKNMLIRNSPGDMSLSQWRILFMGVLWERFP